jgi:hypothetical protein
MSGLSYLLATNRGTDISRYIQPGGPLNFKLNRNFNTNYANISKNMLRSQYLMLRGSSQQVQVIGRLSGKVQFGNSYLGEPININYLGFKEGQPGGSGAPPRNSF